MELTFKTKNKKQLEAASYWCDNTTDKILFGGSKGGGKSYLGANLVFSNALTYSETHYFIARKELTDLRKFTIPTINEVFTNWGLKLDDYATFNGQDNCYTLYNKSKVYLIACKEEPSDPMFERFGSMQMTQGWIEEGGEVAELAAQNLWLSVGRWKNDVYGLHKKLLITCNPKKGWMKRDFIEPAREGILPDDLKVVLSNASDNTYLPEGYVKTLSEIKDEATRERLFLGNWDYDEDKNAMVSFEAISDAFSNTTESDGNRYLIIDVARYGKDFSTFNLWDGLDLVKIEKRGQQSTETTKQQAKDFAAANRVPWSNVMIDEDGIGGALVDGMMGTRGFVANSSPLPTLAKVKSKEYGGMESTLTPKNNFQNLKTQCAFKLADYINERRIAFKVPEYRNVLIEELTALLKQKDMDEDGKLKIIPKDEVKAVLGHSPDIGDPVIYRMWFELKKEMSLRGGGMAKTYVPGNVPVNGYNIPRGEGVPQKARTFVPKL